MFVFVMKNNIYSNTILMVINIYTDGIDGAERASSALLIEPRCPAQIKYFLDSYSYLILIVASLSMSIPSVAPIRLGDVVPNIFAESQMGAINFHEFIEGKYCLFVSHPAANTPVCTTELGRLASLKEEFAKRNAVIVALSVDTVSRNACWIEDINEISRTKVDFPIISDVDRQISYRWNMLNPEHLDPDSCLPLNARCVFFIGPDKKLKASILYPASTGRNFSEIIRVLDSNHLTAEHRVATPADWMRGGSCMVLPGIPSDEATRLFPLGVNEIRPWLRTTPDPSGKKESN